MYDIAIIGAGPAGATLARLLGEKYRVLLLERRPLNVPPIPEKPGKCCGGLLSANAQQALSEMGLAVPRTIMAQEQPQQVYLIDADNGITGTHARPYINCHRELLDRWLLSLVPGAVDVRCGAAFNSATATEGGVEICYSTGTGRQTAQARMLVGADGANSQVRRQCFPREKTPRKYVAVQGWYEMAEMLNEHVAIFDRTVTDFYGWAIPKDGLLAIGAAFTPHADPHAHFASLLAQLRSYGITPGKLRWREGAMLERPLHNGQILTGNDRVALIGEAAGWISPSTAEGFSYAFRSAQALAAALEPGLGNATARYAANTQPLRHAITREILKCTPMFTPWLRSIALRARPTGQVTPRFGVSAQS
ncbi:MAG: FAD-dependent monooxygenase [bacterium]